MQILVLGATGFIGGHIAKAAHEAGWHVRGLRRDANSTGHIGNLDIEWFTGNLIDLDSLKRALHEVEIIFHAAGYYPTRKEKRSHLDQVNYAYKQIEMVIQAASSAGARRLIYTSSLSTIGFPPPGSNRMANERDYYRPGEIKGSAYYDAKYVMESTLLEAAATGFPAVVLNPTAVFGPGDVHLTLGRLVLASAHGRLVAWLPGIVNVIDVRDVAAAHIQAVEHGLVGERYILGGHNFSIREAITHVNRIVGSKPPQFRIPDWLLDLVIKLDDLTPTVNLTGNHLRALRRWQGFDSSKAVQAFGLSARPFSDTIRDAYEWFVQYGHLRG